MFKDVEMAKGRPRRPRRSSSIFKAFIEPHHPRARLAWRLSWSIRWFLDVQGPKDLLLSCWTEEDDANRRGQPITLCELLHVLGAKRTGILQISNARTDGKLWRWEVAEIRAHLPKLLRVEFR